MSITKFATKGLITLTTLLALAFSFPFGANLLFRATTAGRIYDKVESVPERDTALVLGAAAYPSRLSDMLQDRVDTAIELYQAGKVKQIIMSGAPNEVEGMIEYAQEKGVDPAVITGDEKGVNTMASIQNFAANHDSAVIVSQGYHLPRAIFIARHFGVDAVGLAADKREYAKMDEYKKRELLASTKAMLDLFILGN
jgi:SanA protein